MTDGFKLKNLVEAYSLEGDFTQEEKGDAECVLSELVPPDTGNPWVIDRVAYDLFIAYRITWEQEGLVGSTLQEVLQKIKAYYNPE